MERSASIEAGSPRSKEISEAVDIAGSNKFRLDLVYGLMKSRKTGPGWCGGAWSLVKYAAFIMMKVRKMKRFLISLAAFAILAVGFVQRPAWAQQRVQQPPLITEFQSIEDQWSTAVAKQDQYSLENILSPTFVNISSTGDVTTRDQQVARMYEKGVPQMTSMEQRVVNVRIIEDVAVVNGTYIERTKLNGAEQEERGIFAHVYQHVRETWVCVQSQRTALINQAAQDKKAEKKKSTAALPFHIPLIHQGADSNQSSTPQGRQP